MKNQNYLKNLEIISLCRLNDLWILSRYDLVPKDAVVSLQCQEQTYWTLKDSHNVERYLRQEGMSLHYSQNFLIYGQRRLWLGPETVKDILLEDLRNNVSIMCYQEQCCGCEEIRLKIIHFIMIKYLTF